MVRSTSLLLRVPVIKFRKGGQGGKSPVAKPAPRAAAPRAAAPRAAAPRAAAPPPQLAVQTRPAAPMRSATISDIDLPPRYRRRPPTQEEIDIINGGGVP